MKSEAWMLDRRLVLFVLVGLSSGGCEGVIEAPDGPAQPFGRYGSADAPSESAQPGQSSAPLMCAHDDTTPRLDRPSVRLLTRAQYNNTVRDLFGDDSEPLEVSPAAGTESFDNDAAGLSIDPRLIEHYLSVAEGVASRTFARVPEFVPCASSTDEPDCVRSFLESFGPRAFRRPISPEEAQALVDLFTITRTEGTFGEAAEALITGMLISPAFLYHVEIGDPISPEAAQLTSYEMASRLSYFLWNSAPDEELLAAAEADALRTSEQIRTQATRMLEDPRAHTAAAHFHTQWLDLDELEEITKDSDLYPTFDEGLAHDMQQETIEFLDRLLWEDGDVSSMFMSNFTVANERMGQIYGMDVSGDEFQEVPLNTEQRAGLLTQAGFLTVHAKSNRSSPIHRGVFVLRRIMCQDLPPPPPNVGQLPEVDANAPIRERLAQHRTDPSCAGCHDRIDPIGLAFEHYDAIGAYRTEDERGNPVDASGAIVDVPGIEGELEGAIELSARLAESDAVRECVTRHWFRYAFGRTETSADACTISDIEEQFAANDYRLRDLVIAIVESEAFRHRSSIQAGGCE